MFDRKSIKESFSRAATDYDMHAILQEKIRKQAVSLAVECFPRKATVLDLGCGTAAFAKEKSNLDVDWNITSVDIAYGMCKVANARNMKDNLVINADAGALPLNDASFDCVFSSLVLQWVEKPETVIKEILRVLRPDGTAIVTTFVQGTLIELKEAFSAVDAAPHITEFIEPSELLLRVAHIGGMVLEAGEKTHIQYYDDILSLMLSIKNIGAGNKLSNRRKGLMTPSQLAKMQSAYKMKNGKFPASWRVLTMVIGRS